MSCTLWLILVCLTLLKCPMKKKSGWLFRFLGLFKSGRFWVIFIELILKVPLFSRGISQAPSIWQSRRRQKVVSKDGAKLRVFGAEKSHGPCLGDFLWPLSRPFRDVLSWHIESIEGLLKEEIQGGS